MTCREIGDGGVICGPRRVIVVSRDPEGEHYCFRCRKVREFSMVVRRDDVPLMEDWYGPWPAIECSEGHKDGDLFPGRQRVWDA